MARPRPSFQHRPQRARVDGDLPPGRIEIADAPHEDGIDAFRLTHFKIIIEGSRITRIVLARPELERIDEDADGNGIAE